MSTRLAEPQDVGARGVMNGERAAKIAARRIGISVAEYEAYRASGLKWCYACSGWHSFDSFNRNGHARDGYANICRKQANERYAKRKYARASLATGTDYDLICKCGCGEEVNPLLRVFRARVAEGWTHQQIADDLGYSREYVSGLLRKPPRYLKGHYRMTPEQYEATYQAVARLDPEWLAEVKSARLWRIEWRRLAGAVASAARHQQRDVARYGWRRLAAAVAYIARQELRRFRNEWRNVGHAVAAVARCELRRIRAAERAAERRAHWFINRRREAATPLSLDKRRQFDDGEGLTLGERIARAEDDTAYIFERAELAATLRRIVGDIGPEDVQRMDAWTLQRLQARLLDEGIAPSRPQQAELERLREPNRHAGASVSKTGRKGGGKRTREQQQQVTRDHHVRELTKGEKREHKQRRRARVIPE